MSGIIEWKWLFLAIFSFSIDFFEKHDFILYNNIEVV
jgi:hypothetical protein